MRRKAPYSGTGKRYTKRNVKKHDSKHGEAYKLDHISDMSRFSKIVQGGEQVTLGTLTKENGKQRKHGTIEYLSQIHFNKVLTLSDSDTFQFLPKWAKIGF